MSHKYDLHFQSLSQTLLVCWEQKIGWHFQRRKAFPRHVPLQESHVKSPWTCKPLESIPKWTKWVWVISWSVSVSFIWLYNMTTTLCPVPGLMWLNGSCFESKPQWLKTKELPALRNLLFSLWPWILNNLTQGRSILVQDRWEIWCGVTEYFSHQCVLSLSFLIE